MPLVSASLDSFLVAAVVVLLATTWLVRKPSNAPHRASLNTLVVLHTLYILYTLTVFFPPNIFKRLHIPLTMPSESIRAVLLHKASLDANATLPRPLEDLLARLSSFDARTLYVRFGQQVLQDCEYCKTFDEYALFALPGPVLQYIREAGVIGLLTIRGSHHERWRMYAIAALVCASVLEGYWVATTTVQVPTDGQGVFMLHDTIWTLRQLLFLILPLILHSLPSIPPPQDPFTTITSAQMALQTTSNRIMSLKWIRGAIMRDPTLRAHANQWWDKQKDEGDWVREDDNVQRIAEKLDYGFGEASSDGTQEGKLRANAKLGVNALVHGLHPSK